MNKIAAFLTFILVIAWAYTSWYWYTCNIKGLCSDTVNFQTDGKNGIGTSIQEPRLVSKNLEDDTSIIQEENLSQSSEMISADDVSQNEYSEVVVEENKEEPVESETSGSENAESEDTASGTTLGEESDDASREANEQNESQNVATICETPLIGPIAYGGNNNSEEVKRLEKFLQSQGANVSIDGVYGSEDFEAVKAFQTKYRADILDPWDIANPTGYVFKTTVKKINEIGCQ